MTLLARTTTRQNRRNQLLAEIRVDEQILIEDYDELFGAWDAADRKGDLRIESGFQRLYGYLKNSGDREALDLIADLYQSWMADEKVEERVVGDTKAHNSRHLVIHKANTPVFMSDGCGPSGRAA